MGDHAGVGEPGGERKIERRGGVLALQRFELAAERGADRALGADEERGEDELAFPRGELGADERCEGRAGGITVEGGRRDAVAVFPRDGMNGEAKGRGQVGGDDAEVAGRSGLK